MTQREFYKHLKRLGFTRISLCTGEKTHYFFLDLPKVRLVVDRKFKREYGLYIRDVKDDNWIHNVLMVSFVPDMVKVFQLMSIIQTLGGKVSDKELQ